eukprot:m.626703 g.626703  ORF g.626703 m.626703 type:complete len:66 (+) comp22553_c0_seq30:2621-2818(+)
MTDDATLFTGRALLGSNCRQFAFLSVSAALSAASACIDSSAKQDVRIHTNHTSNVTASCRDCLRM